MSEGRRGMMPVLERVPIFQGFSRPELERLAAILEPRVVHPNQVIYKEAAPTNGCFVLLRGSVRVEKQVRRGEPKTLGDLSPGAVIGHLGLLDGAPYPSTYIAGDQGAVGAVMGWQGFKDLFEAGDSLALKFAQRITADLARRLREATDELRRLSAEPGGRDEASVLGIAGLLTGTGDGAAPELDDLELDEVEWIG